MLENELNVILVNVSHAKALPAAWDSLRAIWLCQTGGCRLLRASFVHAATIRPLRDLTCYRTALATKRSREAQRLEKEREDAGIKLSTWPPISSESPGRRMLAALIDGRRDLRTCSPRWTRPACARRSHNGCRR